MSRRVLLAIEPGRDGAFRHVEALVQGLLGQPDMEVGLAYSSIRSSDDLDDLVSTVQAGGGPVLDLNVGPQPSPGDVRAIRALVGLIDRWRPDLVHAHSSKAGALVRPAARVVSPRPAVVYTPHAVVGLGGQVTAATGVFMLAERILARVNVERTLVIAISQDEADFLSKRLGVAGSSVRVVPNAIDAGRFAPPSVEARVEARRRWGIPTGATVVGVVARTVPQKDLGTLYAALFPLMTARQDLYMLHVGSGPQDGMLRQSTPADLRGRVIRTEVAEPMTVYAAADLLALSSRFEAGWPLVMLEAMCAGLPVVTTSAPGMSDLPSAGFSHLWTSAVGDPHGMRRNLAACMSDLSGGRPNNHRELVTEGRSHQAHLKRTLAVYEEAWGSSGASC